jgi:selenocysteine-specific elongation factor
VDVPGHERFVRNMLAGVGGMDLVLLHVAADESVMPQTREHFDICRLLRVPAGAVVITKSDLADEAMLEVVRLEVRDLVAGSFLEGAPVLAVSARTGAGLPELRRMLAALAGAAPERPSAGPPRLPIDRVFSMRGFGTVVTGTLLAGALDLDDDLVLLPSGRGVKVRGLQVHGEKQARADAGQRVAVNLAGVDVDEVGRGETLARPDAATVTRRVDVKMDLLASARPLRHGARVRFHQGTRELLGRVVLAGVPEVRPGSQTFARLHLEKPAVLVRGDRFILRAYSPLSTIAGGVVLDPLPPRKGIRTRAALARFEALADPDGDPAPAVMTMVEEAGLNGLPLEQVGSRAGAAAGAGLAAGLERSGQAVRIGNALLSQARLGAVQGAMLARLEEYHAAHPLEEGMSREELRARLFGSAPVAVFEHVLAALVEARRAVARDRVALAGHSLALSPEEARVRDGIAAVLNESGLTPPDPAALAVRLGSRTDVVERMTALLVRQKVLVRIGDLLFHEAVLAKLKAEIRALKLSAGSATIDVAGFKDRFQVTRKYAIPLLEFLDRERVTRRVGETRHIL